MKFARKEIAGWGKGHNVAKTTTPPTNTPTTEATEDQNVVNTTIPALYTSATYPPNNIAMEPPNATPASAPNDSTSGETTTITFVHPHQLFKFLHLQKWKIILMNQMMQLALFMNHSPLMVHMWMIRQDPHSEETNQQEGWCIGRLTMKGDSSIQIYFYCLCKVAKNCLA